jgi:hypothetical protein
MALLHNLLGSSWPNGLLAAVATSTLLGLGPRVAAASDGAGHQGALAAECRVSVFGPQTFTRSKGKPRLETIPFATSDASAPHVLRVDNGGASGELRPVSSALGVLNGRGVLSPQHVKAGVRTLERAIDVLDENILLLRLAGKPRSGLSLEVFAIDSQPPVVLGTSPTDGTTVSRPEVTLSISVEELLSEVASVTCSGLGATAVEDEFACTTPLLPGPNAIEIVATDACMNSSSTSLTIVFDPPPVVVIESPENGRLFFAGPVEVRGTVNEPGAEVRVNGLAATGSPAFSATVPVGKGENTLRALARDSAGGVGSDSVEVTVLTGLGSPTLAITLPGDDFLAGSDETSTNVPVHGRIRVGGVFGPGNAPSVTVNGAAATVRQSSRPGLLCAPLDICWWDFVGSLFLRKQDNPNLIEAVGTDALGRTDSASVSGRVDICVVGDSTGNALEGGADGQSDRCHEIDGCSTPEFLAPDVQDPARGTLGRRSTAFGKDVSGTENLPHGVAPGDDLPCNHHDVCYQTCGAKKVPCDGEMYERMLSVCTEAYPEGTCPYMPDLATCAQWRREKDRCFNWAERYKNGLGSPPALTRFNQRQDEFCEP